MKLNHKHLSFNNKKLYAEKLKTKEQNQNQDGGIQLQSLSQRCLFLEVETKLI